MISQIIAEVKLNIGSILKNFKIFIKKLCQKGWAQNFKESKDQNNYFRAKISKKEPQLLRLKLNRKIDY